MTLQSRIEMRIEQEAEKYASQRCFLPEDQAFIVFAKIDHKAGATNMLPLLMEMAEALEFYANKKHLEEDPLGNPNDSFMAVSEGGKKSRTALHKREAWAEGKE